LDSGIQSGRRREGPGERNGRRNGGERRRRQGDRQTGSRGSRRGSPRAGGGETGCAGARNRCATGVRSDSGSGWTGGEPPGEGPGDGNGEGRGGCQEKGGESTAAGRRPNGGEEGSSLISPRPASPSAGHTSAPRQFPPGSREVTGVAVRIALEIVLML